MAGGLGLERADGFAIHEEGVVRLAGGEGKLTNRHTAEFGTSWVIILKPGHPGRPRCYGRLETGWVLVHRGKAGWKAGVTA